MNFINLGIREDLNLDQIKRIRVINSISLVTFVMLFLFAVIGIVQKELELILMSSFILPIVGCAPLLNHIGKYHFASMFYLIASYIIIFNISLAFGPELHTQYFLLAGIGMPLIFIPKERKILRLVLALVAIPLFIFLALIFNSSNYQTLVNFDDDLTLFLQYFNDFLMFCTVFLMFIIFTKQNDLQVEKIRNQREKLRQINEDLEQFAYIVSHDLKAPLRAIDGLISFIHEDHKEVIVGELKEKFDMIQDRSEKMDLLISAVLKYSRAGRENASVESFTINQLVQDLNAFIDQPEKVKFINNCSKITIKTAKIQLIQTLQNLISNGLKFNNNENPEVVVEIQDTEGMLRIKVSDNGPGIDTKNYDSIFQIFKTVHGESRSDSTGIGLSIVKKIVETNGGKIYVESILGAGSTFTFTWKCA